jgi:ribosomal protein S18 acetylase RimI-like enzyme
MGSRQAITIRSATLDDLPELKAVLRESVEYLNALAEPEPISDEEIDRIEQLAFGPGRKCSIVVAESDGAIAGHLAYFWGLSMEGISPAIFVGDLYVRNAFRRSGVGRSLMDHVRAMGKSGGANQVVWTVWSENREAQRFYQRIGARPYDEEVLMTWPVLSEDP